MPKPRERNLGVIVRRLRQRQKMSVRKLAAAVDFSPSFISQVENNRASPSISSLERLAEGLGVTLAEFFKDHSRQHPVTFRTKREKLTSGWSRARLEALGPVGAGRRLEAMLVTISPGGTSGKRAHSHPGERFAMVLDGTIRLTLGQEEHVLHQGDAVTINSDMPHRWVHAGKKRVSLVIVTARPDV